MAVDVTFVLVVMLAMIFATFWSTRRRPKSFPPGPKGLPFVGMLFQIDGHIYTYFYKLSKKYGNVFSIVFGSTDVVVLNDWKSFKEGFLKQSEAFAGRPALPFFKINHEDIVTSSDRKWKTRKRFASRQMRELDFGKQSMEYIIMNVVNSTIDRLQKSIDGKVNCDKLFFKVAFKIIYKVIAGSICELSESTIDEIAPAFRFNVLFLRPQNSLNYIPFLRYIPGYCDIKRYQSNYIKIREMMLDQVAKHTEDHQDGEPRDLIDVYLKEIKKREETNIQSDNPFTRKSLVQSLFNLYMAGTDSLDATMTFSIFYMIVWPDIQRKVQTELDQVVGSGRLPNYNDRKMLPYTCATILEIHRYASVGYLGVPRATKATVELCGYTIPKGTCVMGNIWAVHNDEDLWGDPEVFRPERFLNADGQCQKPEYLIPFSTGARYCPGEYLGKMVVFLFFSSLFQRYSFQSVENPPSMNTVLGTSRRPQPFNVTIKQRLH